MFPNLVGIPLKWIGDVFNLAGPPSTSMLSEFPVPHPSSLFPLHPIFIVYFFRQISYHSVINCDSE